MLCQVSHKTLGYLLFFFVFISLVKAKKAGTQSKSILKAAFPRLALCSNIYLYLDVFSEAP